MVNEIYEEKNDKLDELTGVLKREYVIEYMSKLIGSNKKFALMIMDLDNFKYINDGYGHLFGDHVLAQFGEALKELMEGHGIIGRYGGDEFIGIWEDCEDYDDVWQNLHTTLGTPNMLADKKLVEMGITVTIGCSRFPKDATDMDGIFELADKALYRGKMKGRNCFIIYLPEKHANINLKTERDKIVSSMYLHSKVFNALTKSKKIKNGVKETINFLGNYFMIDHLCLTDDNGLYCEYFHPLCKKRDFKLYKKAEIGGIINTSLNMFYLNSTAQDVGDKKVVKDMLENAIYSVIYCEVAVYGKFFGYIRADVAENPRGRVWQNLDMDVLLNFAHVLAIELYYQHMDLADLDD